VYIFSSWMLKFYYSNGILFFQVKCCGIQTENSSVACAQSPSNWRNILQFTWRIYMVNWRDHLGVAFATRSQRIRRVWGNILQICILGADLAEWRLPVLKFHLIPLTRGKLNISRHVYSRKAVCFFCGSWCQREGSFLTFFTMPDYKA
jgi:hypothetical protein